MAVVVHRINRRIQALHKDARLVIYLDGLLFISPEKGGKALATAILNEASAVIAEFGLSVKASKTVAPSQRCEFLGVVIDSHKETLSCPESRVDELLDLCRSWSTMQSASRLEARSFAGKLSFAATVLPGARPFMRSLFDFASKMSFR